MIGCSEQFVFPPKTLSSADVVLRDGTRTLTADWDAGSWQIRAETFYADVATGTAPFVVDSTTKVDNLNADMVDGLHAADLLQTGVQRLKERCRVATTGNITLAGDQTIDGVDLDAGDRVLVRAQTTASENGIYVVDADSGDPWTRAADLPAADNAAAVLVVVTEGTLYSDTLWLCTDDDGSDVVGTNDLTFRLIASPGGVPTITASDGATVTFDLNAGNAHEVTLGGNRTLALSNVRNGQRFLLKLTQDGTGSRTVTWFSGISWAGGSEPTLTTTASKSDVFGFVATGAGAYDGFVVGQDI